MQDSKAAGYQTTALQALDALSEGDTRPKTLHRLRIHLRRLQAHLQLIGEDRNAEVLADCVSRLSKLRALHVFARYLARLGHHKSDVRTIRTRIRTVRAKLDRKRTYDKIRRRVYRHALSPIPSSPDWLAHRMTLLRRANAEHLRQLIADSQAKPRRKRLHLLRLMIKSIRYQEEWALDQPYARPDAVTWLKQAQTVLGDYEELAEFRRLAIKLGLQSCDQIENDWRRARTRARALPFELAEMMEGLAGGRIRLLRTGGSDKRAAGGR
jgi:CHAD domain-containing protein